MDAPSLFYLLKKYLDSPDACPVRGDYIRQWIWQGMICDRCLVELRSRFPHPGQPLNRRERMDLYRLLSQSHFLPDGGRSQLAELKRDQECPWQQLLIWFRETCWRQALLLLAPMVRLSLDWDRSTTDDLSSTSTQNPSTSTDDHRLLSTLFGPQGNEKDGGSMVRRVFYHPLLMQGRGHVSLWQQPVSYRGHLVTDPQSIDSLLAQSKPWIWNWRPSESKPVLTRQEVEWMEERPLERILLRWTEQLRSEDDRGRELELFEVWIENGKGCPEKKGFALCQARKADLSSSVVIVSQTPPHCSIDQGRLGLWWFPDETLLTHFLRQSVHVSERS